MGASGLVFAYFGYLAARGFGGGSPWMALAGAGVIAAYGAEMASGIVFAGPGVSWEGHLAGTAAGLAAGWSGGSRRSGAWRKI